MRTAMGRSGATDLRAAVLLPTPQASDAEGTRYEKSAAENGWKRPSGAKAAKPLSTMVRLLPTPAAADGERGPDYAATRVGTGGDSLTTTVAKLLPTPTAGDGKAAGSRNLEGSKAHAGVSLTDAVRFGNSETPRLIPTPAARDAKGGNGPNYQRDGGDSLPDAMRLLPTPRVAAARTSRRAMVENRQWAAPSLEQAIELSQGELPREFNTWDEIPGWNGELTNPRSAGGSTPSDAKRPGQLTIEAA